MKQRIITGAIAFMLFCAVVYYSSTPVYPICVILLAVIGCIEMLKCIGLFKKPFISVPSIAYTVLTVLYSAYYSYFPSHFFRYGAMFSLTLAFMFILLLLMVFCSEKAHATDICTAYTMIVYITVCFSSLIRIRYVDMPDASGEMKIVGHFVYLLIFTAAWVTDIFAYFGGMAFGKHKLCPSISPKKTVEGSVCGMVACIIAFIIYGLIVSKIYRIQANYLGLSLIALIMSVLSQCGDLLASVIKRTYSIKDYGKLFPGHGGVLDRFDSTLLLMPFLLIFAENGQFLSLLFHV